MILLDTNVISELMRALPHRNVERWVAGQAAGALFITAVTEAELRHGIALLPAGKRQDTLLAALDAMLDVDFDGRILPFDSAAAVAYAEVAVQRRRAGTPISQFDAQIAGIARSLGASLATRNVTDFRGCGIRVIDPWTGSTST